MNQMTNTERKKKRKKEPWQIREPTSQTMNQIQKKEKSTMTDQTSQPKMKSGILTQLNLFLIMLISVTNLHKHILLSQIRCTNWNIMHSNQLWTGKTGSPVSLNLLKLCWFLLPRLYHNHALTSQVWWTNSNVTHSNQVWTGKTGSPV